MLEFINSKSECMDRCLSAQRYECRSATYEYSRRICKLSDEDRFSRPSDFAAAPNVDYMENQCTRSKSSVFFLITVVSLS